jgi:hypothetical protein
MVIVAVSAGRWAVHGIRPLVVGTIIETVRFVIGKTHARQGAEDTEQHGNRYLSHDTSFSNLI